MSLQPVYSAEIARNQERLNYYTRLKTQGRGNSVDKWIELYRSRIEQLRLEEERMVKLEAKREAKRLAQIELQTQQALLAAAEQEKVRGRKVATPQVLKAKNAAKPKVKAAARAKKPAKAAKTVSKKAAPKKRKLH